MHVHVPLHERPHPRFAWCARFAWLAWCARFARPIATIAAALATLCIARTASAVDPFEIQVYDGTANQRGMPGLELHTNAVVRGLRTPPPPGELELPQEHQLHFTLEPSYGVTSWWEIGGYFQTAIADGSFDYAGVKLRSKFVTPPGWHPHLRLGVNFEVSLVPTAFDANEWGTEMRPIVAWENDWVMLVANPILTAPLAGDGYHRGPTFEPAVMALYKIHDKVSIGLEYYGDIGPIASPEPVAEQAHYLFEVMNLLAVRHFELNLGFGQGLTSGSNRFVAKLILGYSWERAEPPRESSRRARVFRTNSARE